MRDKFEEDKNSMKAIILVAGYATRLYPLTKNKPKALLELDNKPIMNYIVDEINKISDITEIIVVSNDAFYNNFASWQKSFENPIPIKVINDGTKSVETRLGAIGDIQFTIETCNIDDDIMVIAGDNYFTFELKDYYEKFKNSDYDYVCAKVVKDKEEIKNYAVAVIDNDHRIVDLEEKPSNPKSDIAIFATYMYKKQTVPLFKTYLDDGNNKDAPGYFVQWLYKEKEVRTYIMDGECYDIGTPEAYKEVNEIVTELNKKKNKK